MLSEHRSPTDAPQGDRQRLPHGLSSPPLEYREGMARALTAKGLCATDAPQRLLLPERWCRPSQSPPARLTALRGAATGVPEPAALRHPVLTQT